MIHKIGITIGDFNGIGPEIALKAFPSIDYSLSTPILLSPKSVIDFYSEFKASGINFKFITDIKDIENKRVNVLQYDDANPSPSPGCLTKESGQVAMHSIESAIRLSLKKKLDAMVTLPISKEAVNLAGYKIPGHTEFLAGQTNTRSVLMMLVNDSLRVALTTVHIPISKIASNITFDIIHKKVTILNSSLKSDFGIENPEIAVLGLNPHAGDGGIIGLEEIEIIIPAIKELRSKGLNVSGPFPADGFFGQKLHLKYDAILAMYHDQGLAPFKLMSFGKGVNFTAGLPIIRTSPDHGTAFDIAGNGVADPSSFIEAYQLAIELAHLRKINE
ncbi:MAG: 4-hydroxythreonine-4-phosphate dehydrogenase PdxA [Balneola sp.]